MSRLFSEERVFLANDEGEMDAPEGAQPFPVAQLGHEMAGHDRLQIVAVETVEEGMEIAGMQGEIITPAEGEGAMEEMRVAHGHTDGVECAEAASVRDEGGPSVGCAVKGTTSSTM